MVRQNELGRVVQSECSVAGAHLSAKRGNRNIIVIGAPSGGVEALKLLVGGPNPALAAQLKKRAEGYEEDASLVRQIPGSQAVAADIS